MLAQNALGSERRPQQAAREERRVALRLGRERVVAVDDFQPGLAEVPDALDDVERVECGRRRGRRGPAAVASRGARGGAAAAPRAAAKGLLGVPDQALEVYGEDDGRVAASEDLL